MNQPRPFADSVLAYAQAGWPCVFPVPINKHPPPVGFTGADGRDTDPMQLATWAGTHAEQSIALRMPDGVIGIDVDQYEKGDVAKHGLASLTTAFNNWGPLPATWSSTARGPGPSRISFYRVPEGRYATKLTGGDVEIIQRHHRYAVVWPSPHPEVGDTYRWYDPAGQPSEQPPKPNELPELPAAWVTGLAEGATAPAPGMAAWTAGDNLLQQLLADERPACAEITSAALTAVAELSKADAGSRHDTATARVHQLVQLAAAGHPGLGRALPDLAQLWANLTAGEDRSDEWERMLLTSARKAVTAVGTKQVANDPCMIVGSIAIAAPAPADDRPGAEQPEPIEPPRELHPREVIGSHPFDPRAFLDQVLAEAVLERMYPVMRYGYDAKTWLLRGRTHWESRTDLADWAVALMADMMPRGDVDAEKGSDERDRAERRKRFMSAGTASGIAKKMRAVVTSAHPYAVRVAELDTEPWLLWAGGVAWDLSASRAAPVQALIDPATPHLHAAGVTPDTRPTPLWDAFTAAVWPDPELRAWALRVLAIALTGYSDKALPIMTGERDRGKTQAVVLLMSVLGSYAHAADPRLLGGADKAHASIIYALKGRRLSFIDEGPRDGRLGQERLKQLTGGADLTGNEMNRNPITFTPTHTLVLTANDEPLLTDPAVRGRVRLIPCEGDPTQVRAARRAIGHPSGPAWRHEAPGVLAAMMREAAAWLADQDSALTENAPEAYRYRAEEIAADQDPVSTWVEDDTEPHPPGERSRTLYEAFVGWCRNGNTHPGRIPSETKWGKDLNRLGHPVIKRMDGNYRPLRLRPRGFWSANGGSAPAAGASVQGWPTNPPATTTPETSATETPLRDPMEGVESQSLSSSHTHTHAHTKEQVSPRSVSIPSTTLQTPVNPGAGEPAAPPQAVQPPSIQPISPQITANLLAAKTAAPRREPTEDDAAPRRPAITVAERAALSLEFHELAHQQYLRLEEATRGHLHNHRGGDSEEVLRYFGEGEFSGDGVEQRLTWPLFLDQRRPGLVYEKAQQAAYDAGHKLGRRHAFGPDTDSHDADYEKARKRHDHDDVFAQGYTEGLVSVDAEIGAAGGPLLTLPAVVTRTGSVAPIALADVADTLNAFGAGDELTVDVEHTGYPIGHADYQLRTIQLGGEHAAVVLDAHDQEHNAVAAELLAAAKILHAHSATADLIPLADAGVIGDLDDAWDRMHDTAIPAKLSDPSSTGNDADLKGLAAAVLGDDACSPAADEARAALFKAGKWLTEVKTTTPAARSGWANTDPRSTVMIRYAASDVLDDAALARRLPAVPPAVLDRERAAQRMTARVTHIGLALDGEHVARLLPQQRAALADAGDRLRAFGIENPGSDQQIATIAVQLGAALPHTKTGRPSVAQGVLEPYRRVDGPLGDFVRGRLDYQKAETALGLFLEPYDELVHRGDGRARPTIYTLGADTGRMSCVRPNLQQMPREGSYRACITADPGQLLISADFASIEIRAMAALSGDTNLHRMLADGVDIHAMIAAQVFGDTWTKSDRYTVKRGVFGWAYGGGVPTLARQVGASESTMAAVVDTLAALAPEYVRWSQTVKDAVKAGHTQFPTYSGRIIHLPGRFPHKAPNYCIQGTARELLVDTLVRWQDTRWACCVLLPVHDELVVAVPENEATEATAALVAAMETDLHGVAIAAEASEPSFAWRDAA